VHSFDLVGLSPCSSPDSWLCPEEEDSYEAVVETVSPEQGLLELLPIEHAAAKRAILGLADRRSLREGLKKHGPTADDIFHSLRALRDEVKSACLWSQQCGDTELLAEEVFLVRHRKTQRFLIGKKTGNPKRTYVRGVLPRQRSLVGLLVQIWIAWTTACDEVKLKSSPSTAVHPNSDSDHAYQIRALPASASRPRIIG